MRHENVQASACSRDPRRALCETKYFSLRPQPLLHYVYSLRLSQIAERVFWLHWDAGYLNGDFTSEIPIREVARKVFSNVSSVTRAYQRLRELGLLRRQDPGRDAAMPFCQAVAVTEVFLPRHELRNLLAAPDRKRSGDPRSCEQKTAQLSPTQSAQQPPRPEASIDAPGVWGRCVEVLKREVGEQDFATWVRPLQVHAEGRNFILYAPNQFVVQWIQAHAKGRIEALIRAEIEGGQVLIQVGGRPAPGDAPAAPRPCIKAQPKPRKLSTLALAELRNRLSKLSLGTEIDDRLREVIWSVERGALAHKELKHAINTALCLVRKGVWTRPNRMPPNWCRAAA